MKAKTFFLLMSLVSTLCVGNENISYEASWTALYLQPNSTDLHYGAEALPLPVPTPNWKSLDIRPDLHFGFEIALTAYLNNCDTFLTLSWERLHSHDSASRQVSVIDMVASFFNIGPDANSYKYAAGHVDHHFDAIDLNVGKRCLLFGDLQANFFTGVGFVRIKQAMHSFFSNNAGTITRTIDSPSLFTGAGPQFGMDFSYEFCQGLSFDTETLFSLLFGSLKNHTTFLSTSPLLGGLGITPPNTQNTNVPTRTQIVPALCGKLGLSYETCCQGYGIKIGCGYQAQVYFNAIQSVDMDSEVSTPPEDTQVGVYALGFDRKINNFFLSGPYLNLELAF